MLKARERIPGLWRQARAYRFYLILFGILLLSIIFFGLNNPTGIVLGWLAASVLAVALVRKWRRPRYFLFLLAGTFLGAIFLSFLYMEVALRFAEWVGGPGATDNSAWRIFHQIISNVILLGTPVGIFFGFIGFIITGVASLVTLLKRNRAAGST